VEQQLAEPGSARPSRAGDRGRRPRGALPPRCRRV